MTKYILVTLLILSTGCNSRRSEVKNQFIEDFDKFVTIVEYREAISDSEWVSFDSKYAEFSETRYAKLENEFAKPDFERIDQIRSRYKGRRFRSSAANSIKEAVKHTKQFFEELAK